MEARAREVAGRSGLPISLAREVAIGRVTVNEALHRLMRREKAERLMRQHGLSRSAAFNVASGHLTLELAMLNLGLAQCEARQPDRSVLLDAQTSAQPATFFCFDEEPFEATVTDVETYDAIIRVVGSDENRRLPKHAIKFVSCDSSADVVVPLLTRDKKVAAQALGPSTTYRDRFRSSKRTLYLHHRDRTPTRVVLRDGTALTGFVGWFGKWEFELALVAPKKKIGKARPVGSVAIFRHGLQAVDAVK